MFRGLFITKSLRLKYEKKRSCFGGIVKNQYRRRRIAGKYEPQILLSFFCAFRDFRSLKRILSFFPFFPVFP